MSPSLVIKTQPFVNHLVVNGTLTTQLTKSAMFQFFAMIYWTEKLQMTLQTVGEN